MSVARWTDSGTIDSAQAFMREAALGAGWTISGPIEQPHVRPWATVFRAPTARGWVYLKLCGPSQDFEPALTALLSRAAPGLVPEVLAIHPHQPWLLLADGGARLRDVLAGRALVGAWVEVLPRYAELQLGLLGQADAIRACGTPDRRLERLGDDLRAVLDDDRVLGAAGEAFGPASRERVRALLPDIERRGSELASLGIGPTVQHDDLHDGNLLRKGTRTVIFDWGDACLTQPLLSLGVLLRSAAKRAGLGRADRSIVRLRSAYLEPFASRLSRPAIEEAADLGERLSTVTRALAWYRVVTLDEGALELEPAVMGRYLAMVVAAFGTRAEREADRGRR